MKYYLGDIDHQPGYPAVPLLESREELCHKDKHGHTSVEIRVRVQREHSIQQPAPYCRHQKHAADGQCTLEPAELRHLQGTAVSRALFILLRMCPPVMAKHIDGQGNRLEQKARIEVLVEEHQEEGEGIEISYPEIIFRIASRQEHTAESQHRCDDVDKEQINASVTDGVLTIDLPKKSVEKKAQECKVIEIK